ncbi:DUF72 domain-containing protein [Rhizobium sp. L1K21]|uniref:DUF72 domain-containing protein n=1 Tax=Rhizobium sp. L1K21 TaxID=2954933 RepID=UPI002093FF01|nr:DUF72 domain-containing protein [Rhizobium sp. L1K21]MCO6186084.1 DUF72 domain-containing protein [Rhizobium sp. L1K21]
MTKIRTGIGGWTFEPWRNHFYPSDLKQKDELAYASSKLSAIEINGTYYSTQKPATFAKWASETPDDFIFSLKAVRYATNRRVLAEAGESVAKFLNSGVTELGSKLGPILWQFMPTKKFDPDDFAAFLALLPEQQDGISLRHVVEVRHPSFVTPKFVELLRKHNVACVLADHEEYPMIADVSADFVYARLQRGVDENPICYDETDMDAWSKRLSRFADGGHPDDLPALCPHISAPQGRDVFAFFITGGKVNAPFGAMEMMKRVS